MVGLQSKNHIFRKEIRLSDSNLPKGTRTGVLNNGKVSCGVMSQNLKYLGQSDDSMWEEETRNSSKICVCKRQKSVEEGQSKSGGCISAGGFGDLIKIDGIMNAEKYRLSLFHHAVPSGRRLVCPNFIFQHDNDSKHTSKKVIDYLQRKENQRQLQLMVGNLRARIWI